MLMMVGNGVMEYIGRIFFSIFDGIGRNKNSSYRDKYYLVRKKSDSLCYDSVVSVS